MTRTSGSPFFPFFSVGCLVTEVLPRNIHALVFKGSNLEIFMTDVRDIEVAEKCHQSLSWCSQVCLGCPCVLIQPEGMASIGTLKGISALLVSIQIKQYSNLHGRLSTDKCTSESYWFFFFGSSANIQQWASPFTVGVSWLSRPDQLTCLQIMST